jgi:hypothetical protein
MMSAQLDSLLPRAKLAECIAADAALSHTIAAAVRFGAIRDPKWVMRCELGDVPVDVHFTPGYEITLDGIVIAGYSEPLDPSAFSASTRNYWRHQIECDMQRLEDEHRAAA